MRRLSSVFGKKSGGFYKKKESESLEFTGLKIPRDYYLGMEDYKFWTDCATVGSLANLGDTLLFWRKKEEAVSGQVHKKQPLERQRKFAQIQEELLRNYGFDLSDKEMILFTECFKEDKREGLTRKQMNEVYQLIKK